MPLVGEFRSNQIDVFTGSGIIPVIACLSVRWIGAISGSDLLMVGAIWLALTVAFEVCLGLFVVKLSWERITEELSSLSPQT